MTDSPIILNKALSVRAPWWWFILHGGKDIENRSWPTKFRGTVGLHASKWCKMADALPDMEFGVEVMRKTGHADPARSAGRLTPEEGKRDVEVHGAFAPGIVMQDFLDLIVNRDLHSPG